MNLKPLVGFAAVVWLAGAGPLPLPEASQCYKATRDLACLSAIASHLQTGMDRQEVERILGEPDYSPTDGLYYYSANEPNRGPSTKGLIVEYRDQFGAVTDELQEFSLERLLE
jgi:outer membrane protein assembly factor BamE (lipoprotein component of BamABCDE complex)